jgi:hypothetical protein
MGSLAAFANFGDPSGSRTRVPDVRGGGKGVRARPNLAEWRVERTLAILVQKSWRASREGGVSRMPAVSPITFAANATGLLEE